MAKKKKRPSSGPSNAYLISFGDTMTALLAFFIVINSLAKEQTGANLYAGTGSFVNALNSTGLPGSFKAKASENAFQRSEPGPLYMVNDDQNTDKGEQGEGNDKDGNSERVLDREKDQLRRFLIEMESLATVQELPKQKARVVIDLFEPIRSRSPRISKKTRELFHEIAIKAGDPNYQIELIVWSNTPSVSSWTSAVTTAESLLDSLTTGMTDQQKTNLTATGKPWFYSNERRPRFSFVVKKLK